MGFARRQLLVWRKKQPERRREPCLAAKELTDWGDRLNSDHQAPVTQMQLQPGCNQPLRGEASRPWHRAAVFVHRPHAAKGNRRATAPTKRLMRRDSAPSRCSVVPIE